jgi:DNA repair protein RadC
LEIVIMMEHARCDFRSQTDSQLLSVLVGRDLAKALCQQPLVEVFGFVPTRQSAVFEQPAPYELHPAIGAAKELLSRCMLEQMRASDVLSSPAATRSFLCARLSHLEYEAFWCLWLDGQNHLIAVEEAFRGTLTQTSVWPREIVKRGLAVNAAGLICSHNHPSGVAEPSRADEFLTNNLKQALAMVDIRLLDHVVVAGNQAVSLAERGLL